MNEMLEWALPQSLIADLRCAEREHGFVEEIRIRRDRQAYIVASGRNILLGAVMGQSEINAVMLKICRGSVYAYRSAIENGYIPLGDGVRVGVVGRAGEDGGRIVGVSEISELSFRLPGKIEVSCGAIESLLREGASVLIYSPPGEGKSTLLRSLIKRLSRGVDARRVCVVDTREELCFNMGEKSLLVTVLSGYPRERGIEIGVRTMNAQIIVCDEIGDISDARAVMDSQSAGVVILASAHGRSLENALSRSGTALLHRARIFDFYVGIKRAREFEFEYTVNSWEEADACLKACGRGADNCRRSDDLSRDAET